MTRYLKQALIRTTATPQRQPLPGTQQVVNHNGGYVFPVDQWARLTRFLILGSEGGSFYVNERALTQENTANALACVDADGVRVVREIVAVSSAGRAPKNDPAIFALALVASAGDDASRLAALAALPLVCRTGTHLFQFATFAQAMRGWGRGLRRAVGGWYSALDARSLAYQLIKYRQRDGWTHTDLLRLAHPKPDDATHAALFGWLTHRDQADWAKAITPPDDPALETIWAFEQAQRAATVEQIVQLIAQYDLPREALPTRWLNEPSVWEALLVRMPMTALIRNLGVMSRVGLLTPLSAAEASVVAKIGSEDALRKARIHPIALLVALQVYAAGRGVRGSGEWQPTPRVIDALDAAFYAAFKTIEPTGQRWLLALDVSASMTGGAVAGVPGLTPRDASAAMALVTARTEQQHHILGFSHTLTPLRITPRQRLDDAVRAVSGLPFGGTDCALPMLYALEQKLAVDTFVVYTDSETWYGKMHPVEALRQYRDVTGIPARLIVVGMVANGFSIADPADGGMLDVVGFDSAAPAVMADFSRGLV